MAFHQNSIAEVGRINLEIDEVGYILSEPWSGRVTSIPSNVFPSLTPEIQ
jgi:hypothetical protein